MQGALVVTMEREQKLLGEVPVLREKHCPAIRALDEEVCANEVELKGKQNLRLLQKDRRTNVEGWSDTDAARGWLARQAASRSQSFKADLPKLSEVRVHQVDNGEDWRPVVQVEAPLGVASEKESGSSKMFRRRATWIQIWTRRRRGAWKRQAPF